MIVFISTFIIFFLEALFHYNIGTPNEELHLPSLKETVNISLVVFIFSLINSITIRFLTKYFE